MTFKGHVVLRWLTVWLMLLLQSPAFADGTGSNAGVSVMDDSGQRIALTQPARRIVSLAPHLTETLYAVGAGPAMVAAVSYSDYPEAAKALPRVGSYAKINLESLLAHEPDLVVAWSSGNGLAVVERLRLLGLTVYVDESRSLQSVADSMRRLAVLVGAGSEGLEAARRYEAKITGLAEQYSDQKPLSVFYQVWNQPLITINDEHLIADVIRLCGGSNVFADAPGLVPRIGVESVLHAAPQVIVASGMDEARPEWLDDWRRWPSIPAVANDQLYFVPPDLLQRHSPRIAEGARQFCQALQRARQHYFPAPVPELEGRGGS